MAEDILERIVADRRRDLARLGPTFGSALPPRRTRHIVPFLSEPGAILEIKRASPSKGNIAPDLDPGALAVSYAVAGARNVSVLTERNYFKGSLEDLTAAAASRPDLSYLRKDFLLSEEEIEVSCRAGADAALLIARILDEGALRRMAAAARSLGMTPFVEVRDREDLRKLRSAAADGPVLSGVNARDLATFAIDPLAPAALRASLPGRAVYESGIDSAGAAAYARRLGFDGILVGEAAARNPGRATSVVRGFLDSRPDRAGAFWAKLAERRERMRSRPGCAERPLVKICGLARTQDAVLAARLGADLLGFVFAESPRAATAETVLETAAALAAERPAGDRPLFVAVITELESIRARAALSLARKGVVDAIQWHGGGGTDALAALDEELGGSAGRYAAVGVAAETDLEAVRVLRRSGEPRVLADAKVGGKSGGTGAALPAELAGPLAEGGGLWLAGGLGVGTVGAAIAEYRPELVDASSRLEAEKGRKDPALMETYFKEIESYASIR
jgi:indole-3-glycerol phosphate synthase/phosphoribosylanthranilate isomerase